MPKSKDLKKLVRTRMVKSGEAYTTARARVLARGTAPRADSPLPSDERLAELAGTSNETVAGRTGRTWREWVRELDAIGSASMPHGEIAQRVKGMSDISGWWSQSVTVGYERIRGLREIGQRRTDKSFEATKSRTIAAPVSKVYQAFAVKRTRERWLPGVALTMRTQTKDKSLRITWPDDTSVHVWLTAKISSAKSSRKGSRKGSGEGSAKGDDKTQVAIAHVGLADKQDVEARKAYWTERLAALAEIV